MRPNAKAAGYTAAPSGETPRQPQPPMARTLARPTLLFGDSHAHARSPARAGRPAALEGMPRAACAPPNRTTGGMVVGGRWCRCWVQIGGIGVTRHRPGCCTCVLHPSGLTLKRQQSGRSLIPCLQRACRSEHIVADLVLVDLALPVDQASCPWLLWSGMWSATQRSARVASTAVVTAALARSTECHGK